jgi:hypothetical protein
MADAKNAPLRFLSLRFAITFLVTALLTVWVPIVRIRAQQGENILFERLLPMYDVYRVLMRQPHRVDLWGYAALHLGIVLAACLLAWLLLKWLGNRKASGDHG